MILMKLMSLKTVDLPLVIISELPMKVILGIWYIAKKKKLSS